MGKEETETHLNQSADDHGHWELFSDDPFWHRRMAKLGIEPVKSVGAGFVYRLTADMVLIRKGKRRVSDATRLRLAANLRNLQ